MESQVKGLWNDESIEKQYELGEKAAKLYFEAIILLIGIILS